MGINLGQFKSKKNDEWLDWLTDEPAPANIRARMRTKAVERASRPVVRRVGDTRPIQTITQPTVQQAAPKQASEAVSIHITLPRFKKPRVPKALVSRRVGIGAGALVFVLAVGVIALNMRHAKDDKNQNTGVLGISQEKPRFDYLLPGGKVSMSTGNTGEYNTQSKTVSYADSIGGVRIVIHQTPLQDELKQDTDNKIKKIAEDNAFSKTISTANPTAYLGTSAKGQQTVLFSKKGLLVFIQSDKEIDEHDWAEYITNLK